MLRPADHGQTITITITITDADADAASGQWQGERWRLNAARRAYGGPADAVLAQLKQRRAAVLAAACVF